jgi:Tfp pilus assembly protein PilX
MRMSGLRGRFAHERGFSLILTLIVLSVVTVMVFGAFDAVIGGAGTTRENLDQKRALLAAYAGLSAYTQALNNNSNYWSTCPTATNVTVPGSTDAGSVETYSFNELPASSAPSNDNTCDSSNPVSTEVESGNVAAGTFRVEFVGSSKPASGGSGPSATRTVVAQFAPNRFLNYVYFTNYEEEDPVAANPSSPDYTDCETYLWSTPPRSTSNCTGIVFGSQDVINGPLHSNDEVTICGSPTFGRSGQSPKDDVQAENFISGGGNCANNPVWNGQEQIMGSGWQTLQLPPSNEQLLQIADGGNSSNTSGCYANAGCVFTGPTQIQFGLSGHTSQMAINNANINGGATTYYTVTGSSNNQPSNGVVYVVDGSGTCVAYTPQNTDYSTSDNAGCGNATVSGTYNASLTIATQGDIIISGNLLTNLSSTDLLGLIADDFVRVAHPVQSGCGNNTSSGIYTTMSGSGAPTIDAAILSVEHSFIVDNYACGAALGTLTVNGVIAQDYRGPVGTLNTGSGNALTGYDKSYNYDQRLQSLSPPYFLNPVDAGWEVQRVTECGDATGAC